MHPFTLLSAFFCVFLSQTTLANSLYFLTAQSSGQLINSAVDLYQDTSHTLTIEQISSEEFIHAFRPANGLTSVGLSEDVWWVRVQLVRSTDAPKKWYLENGSINIRDFRLYLQDTTEKWQERLSGERVSFKEGRDLPHRSMVLELPEVEDSLVFYLRLHNPAGNLFPLYLWQLPDLEQRALQDNIIYGILYGCIFALLLYNLCLFVVLRDTSYFWYVLLTASGLMISLCVSGHGFQYVWPEQPVKFWTDRTTLPSVWSILMIKFTMVMLYTRNGLRWTHWIFWPGIVGYCIAIATNGLGMPKLASQIMSLIPIFTIPTALWCAVVRSHDYVPARLYLLAYGVVFTSAAIMILRSAGLIAPYPFITYLFPASIALESLLFAFALAYRIQLLRHEKEQALKIASQEKSARIEQIQNSAFELQRLVDERTQDLAKANEQLRQREKELELAAHHDPLTTLPNRRYLLSHAQQALNFADRHHVPSALMVIDLDHFKPINDEYGHDAGDEVLKIMAKRLRNNVRGHDMVARLGGDEFAILISGHDAAQHATEVAERLLKVETQTVEYQGHALDVGLSIGIAEYPTHGQDFNSLYQMADKALYQAKRSGRSCWRRYEPSHTAVAPAPSL